MAAHVQWQVLIPAVDEQNQLFYTQVTSTEEQVVPMVDHTPDTQN